MNRVGAWKVLRRSVVVLGLVGACGVGNQAVRLEPLAPVAKAHVRRPVCIGVEGFADARQDRTRIGVNRDGLGNKIGDVHAYPAVPDWIGQHVTDELRAAGLCIDDSSDLRLRGTVHYAFVDGVRLHGRIAVTLTLSRGDQVLLEKPFEGSHARLQWTGHGDEYRDALSRALLDLSANAVPAIVAAAEGAS